MGDREKASLRLQFNPQILLPGTPQVVLEDTVDDAGEGLLLSLSKG